MKEGKVYILRDIELRAEIIQLYHDVLVAGHGGRQKTIEMVTRNYQWPEIMKNIEKICGKMQYVLKDEEQDKRDSRKVEVK